MNAFIEKIKRENVAEISLNQIYAFGEMLGSGVDGIVFATYITPAKLGSEPQKFALKIANADDLQAQLMLAKEAYTTVRQRQHPNLLSVAGIGKFGESFCNKLNFI